MATKKKGSVVMKNDESSKLKVNEVKKRGDFVVVEDTSDDDKEVVSAKTSPKASIKTHEINNTITVHAPKDEEMEEVSYKDYLKSKEVALTSPNEEEAQSATTTILNLRGQTAEQARSVLADMKEKKQIAEFRFIPIGMPMSMEVDPGRVQVLCDANKKVVDISIS
jgi:hypothetical protein